jgi:hypothetical protein
MTYIKPHKGEQTVVPHDHNKWQVNTYGGDGRGWLISPPITANKVEEIKREQLKTLSLI